MRTSWWAWAVTVLVLLSAGFAGGEKDNVGDEERSRLQEHERATYSADCMACNALQVGSILLARPLSQPHGQKGTPSDCTATLTSFPFGRMTPILLPHTPEHADLRLRGIKPCRTCHSYRDGAPLTHLSNLLSSSLLARNHLAVSPTAFSTCPQTAPSLWTERARSSASC